MKILQQNNQIEKLIQSKFFEGSTTHNILWRAIVIDVDLTGKKFDAGVPGSLRVVIKGLNDPIKTKDENKLTEAEKVLFPIALPLFFQSGFKPNIPVIGDEVFIQFETIEPIGQPYWVTIVPIKTKELK